jgi:hypothetical protein
MNGNGLGREGWGTRGRFWRRAWVEQGQGGINNAESATRRADGGMGMGGFEFGGG